MILLTQFLPYVVPYVSGVPEPMAVQEIRSACIDFCNSTLLDQEVVPVSTTASLSDYDIGIPTYKTLAKVIGVAYEDTWLAPTSIESVRSALALRGNVGTAKVQVSTPFTYFQKTPTSSEISLYPVPATTVTNMLTVRAAWAPSRSATSVEEFLFNDWVNVIAAGALRRLAALPGQTFTNDIVAERAEAQYRSELRAAANMARSGRVAASSRAQLRAFA